MHTIEINQALDLIGAAMQTIEGDAWRKLAIARDILLTIADDPSDSLSHWVNVATCHQRTE